MITTYSTLFIACLVVLHQFHSFMFVASDNCGEPPVIGFEDYIDTIYALSNSARPGWVRSLDETETMPGTETHSIYLYLNGTRCHHRSHHRHRNSISNLASCPYKFVDHIDDNRFPRRLTHALCLCDRPRIPMDRTNTYVCQSVVQYVSVFRKEGCNFRRYWEAVPVACVSISISNSEATSASSSRIAIGY